MTSRQLPTSNTAFPSRSQPARRSGRGPGKDWPGLPPKSRRLRLGSSAWTSGHGDRKDGIRYSGDSEWHARVPWVTVSDRTVNRCGSLRNTMTVGDGSMAEETEVTLTDVWGQVPLPFPDDDDTSHNFQDLYPDRNERVSIESLRSVVAEARKSFNVNEQSAVMGEPPRPGGGSEFLTTDTVTSRVPQRPSWPSIFAR